MRSEVSSSGTGDPVGSSVRVWGLAESKALESCSIVRAQTANRKEGVERSEIKPRELLEHLSGELEPGTRATGSIETGSMIT